MSDRLSKLAFFWKKDEPSTEARLAGGLSAGALAGQGSMIGAGIYNQMMDPLTPRAPGLDEFDVPAFGERLRAAAGLPDIPAAMGPADAFIRPTKVKQLRHRGLGITQMPSAADRLGLILTSGDDLGGYIHELGHAQRGGVGRLLQKLHHGNRNPIVGAMLGAAAGASGNEDLERWAPAVGGAVVAPQLVEESRAWLNARKLLDAASAAESPEIRDRLLRHFKGSRRAAFPTYLIGALGAVGAGPLAQEAVEWWDS